MLKRKRAGQRRERPAALGVGGATEIIRHQPQLVVAAGLVGQAIEQFCELVHGATPGPAVSVTPSVSSSSP